MNAQQRAHLIETRKELIEGQTYKIWCKDQWRLVPVYRVPVDALLLNIDNRRFTAERTLLEEQLGHHLDPENSPEDEQSVISILLDANWRVEGGTVVGQPTKDTLSLEADWSARRQETPIWIRPDGTVPNGNRRLALVKRLRTAKGAEGHEWLDAIILGPDDVDEQELFRMEQVEQLTENFKVRYTDVNLLLTIRDAAEAEGIDWGDPQSMEAVAGRLQRAAGGDQAYALKQLRAIKFMTAFLHDLNADGQYHKLIRRVERFRDAGELMAIIENDYPDDASDMMQLLFSFIRAGRTHLDVRMLRRMFRLSHGRYEKLRDAISAEEAASADSAAPELPSPVLDGQNATGDDDIDDSESEPTTPSVANYPTARVGDIIDTHLDAFAAAQQSSARVQLIQARSRLEEVTRDLLRQALDDATGEALAALRFIVEWADEMRGELPG